MSFDAILLPRVERAGGGYYPSLAAGQPIIISCGNLRAKRPGEATRKQPLPAERPELGAISFFKHAGRRFVRRDLGADAFSRVQGGGGRQATTGRRSPINFLGSARVQAGKQSSRRIRQTLHSRTPFLMHLHRMSNHAGKDGQGVEKRPQELVRQGQGDE